MSLSIGIVGLPNVGKSTLFNALTKKGAEVANYPFCTIDPSVGVVTVPDDRLNRLSQFSKSEKTIPAIIEFVDIAGLIKGASEGEGLGNKFLQNIRETDAIAEVVRIFEDDDVVHVHGGIDPINDIETINAELILADIETVAKRLNSIQKDVKKHNKGALNENEIVAGLQKHLEEGKMANTYNVKDEDKKFIRDLHLLSSKPIVYVLNKMAGGKNLDEINPEEMDKLTRYIESMGATYAIVDANIEAELNELPQDEKESVRQEFGVRDDGINDLIKASYRLLGLETFFTTGEKESRAWTVRVDSTAPQAGAAIHGDFEEKFIKAEVINWETLLEAGSYVQAKEKGQLRTEGKEYIVRDGDVVEFKI